MTTANATLFWFRRDLRLFDNTALLDAAADGGKLFAVFVFDKTILDKLKNDDARLPFIHQAVADIKAALQAKGGDLLVVHGEAGQAIPALAAQLGCQRVFANRDYEPYARQRDERVATALAQQGAELGLCKDQVLFECSQVLTGQGKPYTVF